MCSSAENISKTEKRRVEQKKRALLLAAIQRAASENNGGLFLVCGSAAGCSTTMNFVASRAPAGIHVHGFTQEEVDLEQAARNVSIHHGAFDVTLVECVSGANATSTSGVCFLHLSTGSYELAHSVLSLLAPRISQGAVLYFDECSGQGVIEDARAWAHVCASHRIAAERIEVPGGIKGSPPPSTALVVTGLTAPDEDPQAVGVGGPLPIGALIPLAASARLLHSRLAEEAAELAADDRSCAGLLDLHTLGTARPLEATFEGEEEATRPFACCVRIEVRDQTHADAIEQGMAVVDEVRSSLARGPVLTDGGVRQRMEGAQHFVLWESLGPHKSIRVQPNKSNSVVWLSKAWCLRDESDPACEWPAQRELLRRRLPHADSWIAVLQRAREDGGIDIKDDCRLEDRSALCHQDGNNWMKRSERPLIRLAINVSSAASARSLDYFEPEADKRFLDGEERRRLLVYSASQDRIWHGCAQTTSGYVQGISTVCHGSSAGTGPCLKRILTVFSLPSDHPLARLTAIQRLQRIGVSVYAIDPRHQLPPSSQPPPSSHPPPSVAVDHPVLQ